MILRNLDLFLQDEDRVRLAFEAGITEEASRASADSAARLARVPLAMDENVRSR